jgi:type VI protein secretion system component VasF
MVQSLVALSVLSVVARAQQPIPSAAAAAGVERNKLMAADRQKKMLDDANQLLAMAQQLKDSVDKTRKDELSVQVIKQADQIEKLAKSVKDRMKQ